MDRIDPKLGYERTNLRVWCADCNRQRSRPNSAPGSRLNVRVFRAIRELLAGDPETFPSDLEIKQFVGVSDSSGSYYLVSFLRHRWPSRVSTPRDANPEATG